MNYIKKMFSSDKKRLLPQAVSMVAVFGLLSANQTMAMQMGRAMMNHGATAQDGLSGNFAKDVSYLVTPARMPFYAKELGLDMSNMGAINASIAKLGDMAPLQGSKPIDLTEEEMKRYVKIGTEQYVTCEFCCGVKTLVREDGSPTCACAHSIAMRGTAAYLIRKHPQMTDAEISYELMRQKGLYFPTQMQERMASALAGERADFLPDIAYLTMKLNEDEVSKLRGKAKSAGFTPTVNAPGMVGGC